MRIEDRVRDFIGAQLAWEGDPTRPDELADDTELIDSGLLDSLRVIELAGFLQAEYEFEVNDIDVVYDNFHTIAAITDYVRRKIASRADIGSR
ncbi:acyl carrier protein [Mycobacterium heidelbergense]|uniref:acyl carrier protein n=1 Tax=Mycobacterium heidelbergense TaxID=53376 RepID=UPI003CF84F41